MEKLPLPTHLSKEANSIKSKYKSMAVWRNIPERCQKKKTTRLPQEQHSRSCTKRTEHKHTTRTYRYCTVWTVRFHRLPSHTFLIMISRWYNVTFKNVQYRCLSPAWKFPFINISCQSFMSHTMHRYWCFFFIIIPQ